MGRLAALFAGLLISAQQWANTATGSTNTKRNNRSAGPARPVGQLAGWFEDDETMPVIKQLNQIALESVRHNRTTAAAYGHPYRILTTERPGQMLRWSPATNFALHGMCWRAFRRPTS